MDAPSVLKTNVTPIPSMANPPLQVIANSGLRAAHAIDYLDATGNYIGVYIGTSGNEVLRCIIGGGVVTRAFVVIPANSRVSLRSMTATPITNGNLTMTLMGMGWNGTTN